MTGQQFSHPADQYFKFLVDYLRHLVDQHGIEESDDLWRSGRDRFDALHAEAHRVPTWPPSDGAA